MGYGPSTVNGRGNGSLAAEDWVHSLGTFTGLALGIYSDSSVSHNTGITSPWSTNPADYLAGTDHGTGDRAIGMAFNIGTLNQGASSSFDYHYVMGDKLESVDIPTDVPEPSTLAIFALSLIGLSARRLKK